MWKVTRIDDADFGCEERLPGEPLLVLVTIENEEGQIVRFECPDNWLINQAINEGDEWPEDIDAIDSELDSVNRMNCWMENYYQALEEMNDSTDVLMKNEEFNSL